MADTMTATEEPGPWRARPSSRPRSRTPPRSGPPPTSRSSSPAATTRPTARRCCATRPRTCSRSTPRAWNCSPRVRAARRRPARGRPDHPARRGTPGRAHGRHRPRRRRRRPARAPPLVEIWQANAGGRYIHQRDQHPAPPGPELHGHGPDADRRRRRLPVHDGETRAVPVEEPPQRLAPAHIHFSLFGTDFTQRLVTQMYFPGDPLFALDPIYQSIVDPAARERLVATYDHDGRPTSGRRGTGGTSSSPAPTARRPRPTPRRRTRDPPRADPGPDRGPVLPLRHALPRRLRARAAGNPGAVRLHGTVFDGAGTPRVRRPAGGLAGRPRRCRRPAPGSLHRDGWTFTGFGRCATDGAGHYSFTTLTPGAVDGGLPFFAVTVFARGLLHRLATRAYLPLADGATDPLLTAAAPGPAPSSRRPTPTATVSTCTCRVPRRPSSSSLRGKPPREPPVSELFRPVTTGPGRCSPTRPSPRRWSRSNPRGPGRS